MNTQCLRVLAMLGIFILNFNQKILAVVETYTYPTVKLSLVPPVMPGVATPYDCYDNAGITAPNYLAFNAGNAYNASPYVLNTDFTFNYVRNSIKVSIDRSDPAFFNINRDIRVKLRLDAKNKF